VTSNQKYLSVAIFRLSKNPFSVRQFWKYLTVCMHVPSNGYERLVDWQSCALFFTLTHSHVEKVFTENRLRLFKNGHVAPNNGFVERRQS
jgi:hypothetical protein